MMGQFAGFRREVGVKCLLFDFWLGYQNSDAHSNAMLG